MNEGHTNPSIFLIGSAEKVSGALDVTGRREDVLEYFDLKTGKQMICLVGHAGG